ncbi:MAG TPA: PEP-utilizing enzyme, partial [Acidimicrobiia bacterium]
MTDHNGYRQIGQGLNAFEAEPVEGRVRWLDSPEEVLDFVTRDDVAETIVISRGGTTTFMAPALSAGARGLITLQGAPESHLGIVSREFGIPCLMSVAFTEGVQ